MRQRQEFPAQLREARKRRCLSHRQLGELIGKDRSTVCNYERGVGYPTVKVILLIAQALQVSVDDLLGYRQVRCRKAQAKHRVAKILGKE